MSEFLNWSVILVSCILISYHLYAEKRMGWILFPVAILALRYCIDAGISPLVTKLLNIKYIITDATIIFQASGSDINLAVFYLTLGYGSILFGMLMTRSLSGLTSGNPQTVQLSEKEMYLRNKEYFKGSLYLYCFGVIDNIIVVYFAGKGIAFSEIASTRSLFTNELAYSNPIFNYAELLRTTMLFGALGMLLFSYRLRRYMTLSIIACLFYIGIQPIFGGRTVFLVSIFHIAFLYHYGIKKLRKSQIMLFILLAFVGLIFIAIIRHNQAGFSAGIYSVMQIFKNRTIDEVAFAFTNFPDRVQFLNGGSLAAGLSHLIPGLKLEASTNLWRTLEDAFLGKQYYSSGIGGQTLSTTAESYINFGGLGVFILGTIYGAIFGGFFEWYRKNPQNPLIMMAVISVTLTSFLVGIYKKMPIRISDIPISILLPIALLVVFSNIRRYPAFIGLNITVLLTLFGYKFMNATFIKYPMFLLIIAIYYLCFIIIQRAFNRRKYA